MVRVRVLDHVEHASTYEDGAVIYSLLEPAVMSNNEIELSFDGILAVPSAFVNATIVKLLEVAPLSAVRDSIRIVDSTKQINDLVRQRIRFVAGEAQQDSAGVA